MGFFIVLLVSLRDFRREVEGASRDLEIFLRHSSDNKGSLTGNRGARGRLRAPDIRRGLINRFCFSSERFRVT